MLATIRNSWSQLLTLCCVRHTTGKSKGRSSCIFLPSVHFCTELPEFLCHRGFVRLIKKNRGVDNGYCTAPARCPCSKPACFHRCFAEEDASNGTARWRFLISAGVSILRAHHAALRNVLPGMRQGSQSSLKGVDVTQTLHARSDWMAR
jgi:hypothetical protein